MGVRETVAVATVVAGVLSAVGCTYQPGMQPPENTAGQTLPFARASDKHGISPTGRLIPAAIPAGTPITVRLLSSLSSATSRADDNFTAALDEPIVVQGETVVLRGAAITGRVVAARASERLQDPGYLRLTLASISVGSKTIGLQTSSVFAKGGAHEKRNLGMTAGGVGAGAIVSPQDGGAESTSVGGAVGVAGGTGAADARGKNEAGFSSERRLTFRLTQAVSLN
jgi:hypothetical protein